MYRLAQKVIHQVFVITALYIDGIKEFFFTYALGGKFAVK